MNREEVIERITRAINALNEKRIADLAKTRQFGVMEKIQYTSFEVRDYLQMMYLQWDKEDIPIGGCAALCKWMYDSHIRETWIFKDWTVFADMLAEEAGDWGKSVASLLSRYHINDIEPQYFYSDAYADMYQLYND